MLMQTIQLKDELTKNYVRASERGKQTKQRSEFQSGAHNIPHQTSAAESRGS